jgi:hypothetical protein
VSIANQLRLKSALSFQTGAVNIEFPLIPLLRINIQTLKLVSAFGIVAVSTIIRMSLSPSDYLFRFS